jgi:hypothetical protein
MKQFLLIIVSALFATSAFAIDDYVFTCDLNGVAVQSLTGLKKAPEHPVVGLNIKVLKSEVPLFLIQATFDATVKNLFVTDWVAPDQLSPEGEDLLSLLSLFFGVDTENLEALRAGLPTDLLETFAYLELKNNDGTVTKLAFEGTNPSTCQ